VAATYLGRPIAPLSIDWSSPVRQSFRYPLNEAMVGFGKSDYAAVQDYVVNGWEFTVLLNGAAAIKAWDCLTAAARAGGWILAAGCVGYFSISERAGSSKKVQAVDSGLDRDVGERSGGGVDFHEARRSRADRADYVRWRPGGRRGRNHARCGFDGIDATWEAHRLRYVRLADDVERGKFIADQIQYRNLTVIELPRNTRRCCRRRRCGFTPFGW
jgi:hypothetical protein